MILFILGLLFGIIVETCLILVYNLGKRSNFKANKEEISREQLEKAKKINEGWNNIFNYSVDTAFGRGE